MAHPPPPRFPQPPFAEHSHPPPLEALPYPVLKSPVERQPPHSLARRGNGPIKALGWVTLNIGLTILGILGTAAGLITMSIMLGRQLREIHATSERIAGITREVAFMIRRQ